MQAENLPFRRALEILPQLGIDEYRKALTEREAALVAVLLRQPDVAEQVLTGIQNYTAPSTVAETVLVAWDTVPTDRLRQWVGLGAEKMRLMVGRESGEATRQLLCLWTLLNRQPSASSSLPPNLGAESPQLMREFDRLVDPPWWSSLWSRLLPRPRWAELAASHTDEEKKTWKENRTADGFTARLLLAEALRRNRLGERFPESWVSFAVGGMDAVSFNSDPSRIASSWYRLILAMDVSAAPQAAERLRILLAQNAPTAFGSYEAARFAAWACGPDGAGRGELVASLGDLVARVDKHLNDYERMLVYPQLGAAYALLGDQAAAGPLFASALRLAEENRDPESKRIGLIRLNLGLALGAVAPTAADLARMRKVQADADQG